MNRRDFGKAIAGAALVPGAPSMSMQPAQAADMSPDFAGPTITQLELDALGPLTTFRRKIGDRGIVAVCAGQCKARRG